MANTINDLYQKYYNRIERYIENDGYYQYLLELIGSSENTITQNNRILHKVVDEKWLTAVEDTIPAIYEIIGKPKKFIKSVENLVPVELAKKITAESVQHLSRNTQNIAGISEEMVIPSKILSVENEDSYDLYENRFINTLIKKLVAFIDKRTDIIFWSTGDEHYSILKYNTTLDDDFEEITYNLELSVKSKQNYMENDAEQSDVFKRIDRVRRIVMDFGRSTFAQIMKDTQPVRSPIQRTNLLTKNPHYKKCFALWQFLERYDDVGYEIDIKENAISFDEDYLYQLYTNLAMNYTVFKSLLDADPRKIEDAPPKKRKQVKPKFIKQIVEEFVDNYDIPDVEIRHVIIEEITRAQLEIEKKKREKEKEKAAKEKLREKERIAKEKEKEKEKAALKKAKEAEKAKALKEKEKEAAAAQKAKEAEKLRIAKEKEKAEAAEQKAKEAEKLRLTKEKEKAEAAEQKAKEAEKLRIAKEKEKAEAAEQKVKEAEKIKAAKTKEKERLAAQKAKELEKAKADKAKQKEKERLAAQKAKELEKAKADKAKQKEKERLAAQKAKELEKAKAEKAKEKAAAQKAKEADKNGTKKSTRKKPAAYADNTKDDENVSETTLSETITEEKNPEKVDTDNKDNNS